jgi:hypothetical protein
MDKGKHTIGRKITQFHPITVDVTLGALHRLVYKGHGELMGANLRTRHFSLWI